MTKTPLSLKLWYEMWHEICILSRTDRHLTQSFLHISCYPTLKKSHFPSPLVITRSSFRAWADWFAQLHNKIQAQTLANTQRLGFFSGGGTNEDEGAYCYDSASHRLYKTQTQIWCTCISSINVHHHELFASYLLASSPSWIYTLGIENGVDKGGCKLDLFMASLLFRSGLLSLWLIG